MNVSFELPPLEEMDSERLQAIEALEISNDSVKCQKCGIAVPLLTNQGATESMLCKSRSNGLKITAMVILPPSAA